MHRSEAGREVVQLIDRSNDAMTAGRLKPKVSVCLTQVFKRIATAAILSFQVIRLLGSTMQDELELSTSVTQPASCSTYKPKTASKVGLLLLRNFHKWYACRNMTRQFC